VVGKRRPTAVLRRALDAAIAAMTKQYGANPSTWRRHHAISHLDSLTGVVGPSVTMPFEDRGSWVQEVAFTRRRR
jgi:acyl-homoserine lactone acylase PvdQ